MQILFATDELIQRKKLSVHDIPIQSFCPFLKTNQVHGVPIMILHPLVTDFLQQQLIQAISTPATINPGYQYSMQTQCNTMYCMHE